MRSLANMAAQVVNEAQQERAPREASPTTRKLFMLLHGAYGNQFLAKFHTGQQEDEGPNRGKDKGLLTAMLVWDAQLSRFPGDVIEAAAHRVQQECPEFAPTLPQLVKVCEAIQPRRTYAELQGAVRLPAPVLERKHVDIKAVGDGKDCYRRIWARHLAGDKTLSRFALESAMQVLRIKKGAANP